MLEAAALLDTVIGLFKRYKALFAIVPLVVLLGLSHCSDKRHTRQRDEARAQIVELKAASAANLAAQQAQVKALEARLTEQAKDADNALAKALEADRPAIVRYIDRHRVREADLCRSAPSGTSENPTAPDRDGPGVVAGMVAVPINEFERYVEQSRRLQEVKAWGDRLIADGLATELPEPAFGVGGHKSEQASGVSRP